MFRHRLHFRDLKLRTKFIISFLLIIFISLAMSSALNYYVSTNSIKKITSTQSSLLLDQVKLNFQQKIGEVEELSFLEYNNAGFCSSMVKKDVNDYERLQMLQSIREFLYRMVYSYDYFSFAMIQSVDGTAYVQISQNNKENPLLTKYQLDEKDKVQLLKNRGKSVWSSGDENLVFVKRAMYDVESYIHCGMLIMGVDTTYLKSMYPNSDDSGMIMFANPDGELLIYDGALSKDLYAASVSSESNEFYYDNKRYIYTESSTSDQRWKLLSVVSFDQFTAYVEDTRYWILVTFAVALLGAIIIAAILSKYITNRLNMLVSSMKTLSAGFLDTVIRSDSRDEIGLITERFNMMAAKIKELIQRLSEEKLQKEQAEYKQLEFEYKALQAQMNPHFIYNTLESIHSLAKIQGQQEIGQMIYLLGRLLRESISRKEDFVSLGDEMKLIRDYLSLQSIIYDSRLKVEFGIQEDIQHWIVPRFILQPILENSIVHGIEKKPGVGIIGVRCYEEGHNLLMEVEDNGVGMSEQTIHSLLVGGTEAEAEAHQGKERERIHTRVGVNSVNKRLQILFGPYYGISIQSKLNHGTTIIIKLPKTKRGDLPIDHESNRH